MPLDDEFDKSNVVIGRNRGLPSHHHLAIHVPREENVLPVGRSST